MNIPENTANKAKCVVSSSKLSNSLFIGHLNRTQDTFTTKRDATEEILSSVALLVRDHYNNDLTLDLSGIDVEGTLHMRVTVTTDVPQLSSERNQRLVSEYSEALQQIYDGQLSGEGTISGILGEFARKLLDDA